MKTRGEIEAAICGGIMHFEQELMDRQPKDIYSYMIDDLDVVRLQGVLTTAEQADSRRNLRSPLGSKTRVRWDGE